MCDRLLSKIFKCLLGPHRGGQLYKETSLQGCVSVSAMTFRT